MSGVDECDRLPLVGDEDAGFHRYLEACRRPGRGRHGMCCFRGLLAELCESVAGAEDLSLDGAHGVTGAFRDFHICESSGL